MATSYKIDYAAVPFDESYKTFFENFYRISDDAGANDEYVKQFTDDATLVIASKRASGRADIRAFRTGMWEKVATRHHKPVRLFPFGLDASDVMLYGTVDYLMKDGRTIKGLDWAARAHLVKMNGVVQMDSYQVYLDSAAQTPSK